MLPLVVSSAFGVVIAGKILNERHVGFQIAVASLALHAIAIGLMTSLPKSTHIYHPLSAYEVFLSHGLGTALIALQFISRDAATGKDYAVLMATITQVRLLGASISVAVAQSVLIAHVQRTPFSSRQTLS